MLEASQFNPSDSNRFRLGTCIVRPDLNRVERDGELISIEPRAMEVLVYLSLRPGEVISKDQLMTDLWKGQIVVDHAISRVIGQIRRALGDTVADPKYITTVPKRGYRMIVHPTSADESIPAITENLANLWPWLLVTVSAVLIVIGLSVFFGRQPAVESTDWISKPLTALPGIESYPALSPDGQFVVFSHQSSDGQPNNLYMKPVRGGEAVQLTNGAFDDERATWSADGNQIAFHRRSDNSCSVFLLTIPDPIASAPVNEQLLFQCNPSSYYVSLTWSADATMLFYTESQSDLEPYRIRSYDINSGKHHTLTDPPEASKGDYWVQLNAKGDQILHLRNRNWFETDIMVTDISLQESKKLFSMPWPMLSVSWGLSDEQLIYADPTGALIQHHIKKGTKQMLAPATAQISFPSLSSGTSSIAFVSGKSLVSNLYQVQLGQSGSDANALIFSNRNERLPRFSSDGQMVAFVSDQSGLPQLWLLDENNKSRQLSQFDRFTEISHLEWSPDNQHIASHSDGRVYLIDVKTGSQSIITPPDLYARNPTWSMDSRRLYLSVRDSVDESLWYAYSLDLSSNKLQSLPIRNAYLIRESNSPLGTLHVKYGTPGIWYTDASGQDQLLVSEFSPFNWGDWDVVDDQVYFIGDDSGSTAIHHIDLNTSSVHVSHIFSDQTPSGFSISADHSTLAYTLAEESENNLWLLKPGSQSIVPKN